eukprot:scaffold246_cov242-Pinguiococcus_pyrenoidosus.AAC.1
MQLPGRAALVAQIPTAQHLLEALRVALEALQPRLCSRRIQKVGRRTRASLGILRVRTCLALAPSPKSIAAHLRKQRIGH